MSRTVWVNPNPATGRVTKRDIIFIDSKSAPTSSPAPAGHPVVPVGWVQQMGGEGEVDTLLPDTRSGSTVYQPQIYQFVVPYFTGGWPPDPQAGQPGHTQQRPTGAG